VTGVRKGSPADSLGFLKGDVITALEGKPAAAWHVAEVRAALTEPGARRTMVVKRGAAPDTTFTFQVRVVSIED